MNIVVLNTTNPLAYSPEIYIASLYTIKSILQYKKSSMGTKKPPMAFFNMYLLLKMGLLIMVVICKFLAA